MEELHSAQLALLGCGALFILLSIPLIAGKIGPNMFYGVRTRKTLSDPKIWYEANRIGGWNLVFAGVFIFLVTGYLILFGQKFFGDQLTLSINIGVFIASVGAATIHTLWRTHKL